MGDRSGRPMGIGAEPGWSFTAMQQLVKHLPAVVLRLGTLKAALRLG
jgi:hypothetical protein